MKKLFLIMTLTMTLAISKNAIAQKTIVDVAVGNKDFSTLVTALKAADLVGALQSDGPFTVFAPTNEAFEKIESIFKNLINKFKKYIIKNNINIKIENNYDENLNNTLR
jgi:uncharacterized surface protein with fasciclin (FAS1) repeats